MSFEARGIEPHAPFWPIVLSYRAAPNPDMAESPDARSRRRMSVGLHPTARKVKPDLQAEPSASRLQARIGPIAAVIARTANSISLLQAPFRRRAFVFRRLPHSSGQSHQGPNLWRSISNRRRLQQGLARRGFLEIRSRAGAPIGFNFCKGLAHARHFSSCDAGKSDGLSLSDGR